MAFSDSLTGRHCHRPAWLFSAMAAASSSSGATSTHHTWQVAAPLSRTALATCAPSSSRPVRAFSTGSLSRPNLRTCLATV